MKLPDKRLLIPLIVVLLAVSVEIGRRLHFGELLQGRSLDEAALVELMSLPMTTPTGERRRLSDWQGKVLIVNFWATWCPPCREEIPEFSRTQDQFGPNGVQFVGIALDDADNVAEFARAIAPAYPFLIAPAGIAGLTSRLGNGSQVLPFTIIVGRDGKQTSSHIGRLSGDELKSHIAPLL